MLTNIVNKKALGLSGITMPSYHLKCALMASIMDSPTKAMFAKR